MFLGSGEDFSEAFVPFMGMVAILVMWPRLHKQNIFPMLHMEIGFNLPNGFRGDVL